MRLAVFLIFSLCYSLSSAQVYENYEEDDYYNSDFNRDQPDQELDSIIVVDNSDDPSGFKKIFSGNPGRAAKLSLMVPGWGQVYNGKIWKLPLVYGLEGAAIYYLIQNRSRYNDLNACYISLIPDPLTGEIPMTSERCGNIERVSDAFVIRQAYRKRKELSYVFLVGAHLFQAFEAYIDRHLVDFDVDEDLSFSPIIPVDYTRGDIPLAGIYLNLSPNRLKQTPKNFY